MDEPLKSDTTNTQQTALVTGAAGFIGCHLAERLVRDDWAVRGIDDERAGDWRRLRSPVDRLEAALEEMSEAELLEACEGVDVVYHLAAEKHNTPSVTSQRTLAVNVEATQRLYAAAGRTGVRKVVFASSLYAYGSQGPNAMAETDLLAPNTIYGVSKVAGEHLLRVEERRHGLKWSVARLFFIYGPRQFAAGGYPSVIVRNFDRILRDEAPVVNGDGLQALDYVYVDDCVEALVELRHARHDGLTINVASGNPVTVAELTRAMQEVADVHRDPIVGAADSTAGSRRWGAVDRAAKELHWKATVELEVGLRHVWESLR